MNDLSDIAASDIITVCNNSNDNSKYNNKLVCLTRGRECEGENSMAEWQHE